MGRGLIMSMVRENSEVFTRPPRPASYLCNSQNKGQESIKQTHAWLGTHACAVEKIIQSIMSREEQMNGITDIRRILCGFQSGRVHKITCKCPSPGGHAALFLKENPTNLLLKLKP